MTKYFCYLFILTGVSAVNAQLQENPQSKNNPNQNSSFTTNMNPLNSETMSGDATLYNQKRYRTTNETEPFLPPNTTSPLPKTN